MQRVGTPGRLGGVQGHDVDGDSTWGRKNRSRSGVVDIREGLVCFTGAHEEGDGREEAKCFELDVSLSPGSVNMLEGVWRTYHDSHASHQQGETRLVIGGRM